MSWIATQTSCLLNPEQDGEDARALATLQDLLAATPLADGTQDAISLLQKLHDGLPATIDKLPPALVARLQAWFERSVKENASVERLRALLLPLSKAASADGANIKSLNWPLNTQAAGAVEAIQLQMALNLSGHVTASLTAGGSLPDNSGTAPTDLLPLHISVAGALAVAADGSLPLRYVTLSAHAATTDTLAFDFYSLHAGETLLLAAVAAGLERLATSPFDLGAVAERFRQHELHCITISGKGSLSLGGRLALASPFSLAGGKLDLAEMAYGYTATLEGQFDYQLRADAKQPDKVVLQLSRSKADSHSSEAQVRVGVDLNSALGRIRDETLPFLQKAEAILAQADTLLQPGPAIRQALQESLATLDEGNARYLAPLLEGALGFKSGRDALHALHDLLTQEITRRALDVDQRVDLSAGQLLDRVLAPFPLDDARRQDLHAKLDAGITKALAKIRAQADQKLQALAEAHGAPAIAAAMQEAGIKVQASLNAADQALAGARAIVLSYRQLAAQLVSTLSASTALKLNASLSHAHQNETGATVDLLLRFDPALAQDAFRLAMLGAFDEVLELARQGGRGVEILDCHLRRVLVSSRGTDLEVALLGISASGGTLLSQNTAVDLDAAGNITVLSKADMEKRRSFFGEKRSLRVADIFALASAKQTRSLQFDISVSQEDKKLEAQEAVSFFQSLTDAGLLSTGRAQLAGQYLQTVAAQSPGSNQAGRLAVNLALAGAELDTLMGVDQDPAAFAARVRATAAGEMALAYIRRCGLTEKNILALLKAHYDVAASLPATILVFDNSSFVHGKPGEGLAIGTPAWNHALAVNRMHELGEELLAVLQAMRRLYEISAQDLAALKDPATYQQRQEEIMLYAKDGAPADFPGLFGQETVHPATVALLRILAILAGKQPGLGDVLTASVSLGSGDSQQIRQIA